MIRAIVVEDEHLTMERICGLLRETGRVEVMGGYTNPVEAMEQIFLHQPDAVFLDIDMPEINGLQLAEKVYESGLPSEIVFITAYNEYALEAFKVNALDYLLKPVPARELARAVDRVEKRRPGRVPPAGAAPKVRVTVFGGFNMWLEGNNEPVRWYTAKCRELMAYFLLQGPSVEISKWRLIEALWPERDEEKGDINLRSTLCRINKTLRESGADLRIQSNRNSYLLKAGSMMMDALDMKRLVLEGKNVDSHSLTLYEAAVASYKGSLLEGFEFPWCEDLRVSYQRYYTILCRKLAGYYLEQQRNPALALNTVEGWLQHEPYDEEGQYLALRLYHMTKGKAAADAYFKKLSTMLKEDLDGEPGSEIQELYRAIVSGK